MDKISVVVQDLQTTSTPLIYQTEFNDHNLKIGDNILSQNWGQKILKDSNRFRYFVNGERIDIHIRNQ